MSLTGASLRRVRTEAEITGATAIHAVPAVAVEVLGAAGDRAAMAVRVRGRRAARVFVAGPAIVTGNQLALVRVRAHRARVATRPCGADVAIGARHGGAGAVGLTMGAHPAVIGSLGTNRRGWRRVVTAAVLTLGAPHRRARAGPASITVVRDRALESTAHARAARGGDRACRGGPARFAGTTLVRSDRPALIVAPAGLARRRAGGGLAGADGPGSAISSVACARACGPPDRI
jgi:hypothetical protein